MSHALYKLHTIEMKQEMESWKKREVKVKIIGLPIPKSIQTQPGLE